MKETILHSSMYLVKPNDAHAYKLPWKYLGELNAAGLNKDIQRHKWHHSCPQLQLRRMAPTQSTVNLVTADGDSNFLVSVCKYELASNTKISPSVSVLDYKPLRIKTTTWQHHRSNLPRGPVLVHLPPGSREIPDDWRAYGHTTHPEGQESGKSGRIWRQKVTFRS